jgi:serine/threonine protein kinase
MSSATNDRIKALAKGAVGCIVTPALQCENSTETDDDMTRISKIFKDEGEYKEELASSIKLSEKLKDVKNASSYFIYEATDCKLDAKQKNRLNKEQIKSKCSDPAIAVADTYVLNYDYGGESIESILNRSTPPYIINDVLLKLHNLFEGVIKLNSKLIYHLDLSTDNVLLSHDKMKIIDFGRCFIAEDENSFNATFIKTHFSKNGGNFGKPRYVAPELLATIPGGEYMLAFKFGNELYTEREVNKDYIMDLKSQINVTKTLTLKECFEKADVWALGSILYSIQKVLQLKNTALDNLIENLTNLNLSERATCTHAYDLYQNFVKKFQPSVFLTPPPTPSPTIKSSNKLRLRSPSPSPSPEEGGKRFKKRTRKYRKNKTHRKNRKTYKKRGRTTKRILKKR